MGRVSLLLLSTADTDLLAARAVTEPALPLRLANPVRLEQVDLEGVQLVVVRLLGGRQAWEGLDALLADAAARRIPVVAVGGEGVDAELTAASTVPAGVVADAGAYLREGGSDAGGAKP
jgi:cobaltochelatase CobN